jgi:hypothetical protein
LNHKWLLENTQIPSGNPTEGGEPFHSPYCSPEPNFPKQLQHTSRLQPNQVSKKRGRTGHPTSKNLGAGDFGTTNQSENMEKTKTHVL